jgi:hypothetical protein
MRYDSKTIYQRRQSNHSMKIYNPESVQEATVCVIHPSEWGFSLVTRKTIVDPSYIIHPHL